MCCTCNELRYEAEKGRIITYNRYRKLSLEKIVGCMDNNKSRFVDMHWSQIKVNSLAALIGASIKGQG